VQETLFHEKQTIIEECLFGVDINPNSVKICRLRLWIELLKNAYYKPGTNELETLPNIDINIKCGNSLISRYGLDTDLKQALKASKSKWNITTYRNAVKVYRNASGKEEKRDMERLIADIKSNFRSEISKNDLKVIKLYKLKGELFNLTSQTAIFGMAPKEKAVWEKDVNQKTLQIEKLETEIEEIKNNKIYENAFEWRFEFPEVLNDEGDFVGFDVVIGNPPYIRQEEIGWMKPYLQQNFLTYAGTADMYVFFVELGMRLLHEGGEFTYILPNKWMRGGYGKALRQWVQQYSIHEILDFGDLQVFEEATTYPCIWSIKKLAKEEKSFRACEIKTLNFEKDLITYVHQNSILVKTGLLSGEGWTLVNNKVQALLEKVKKEGVPLGEYANWKIFRGVLTGLNEAFVIDDLTKEMLIAEDPKSVEVIKPFLLGKDIKGYQQPKSHKFLILFKCGDTTNWFGALEEEEAFNKMYIRFPAIMLYLSWEMRACSYYDEFDKPKLLLPDIAVKAEVAFDYQNHYCVNTSYIIPIDDKYLMGILSSKLILFFYRSLTSSIRGGYLRFIRQYLEVLPVSISNSEIQNVIKSKVIEILNLRNENPKYDISKLESEIDYLVYELYELTEDEIKIVEGNF
jgi:hypothetical protein